MPMACAGPSMTSPGALATLDVVVAAAIEGPPQDNPPTAPATGASYIVGASPTGAWAGKAGQLASYGAGGWQFIAPTEGLSAMIKSSGVRADYRAGAWEIGLVRAQAVVVDGVTVVSAQSDAIASPSGGAVSDTQARGAIDAILAALRHHGLIAT